MKAPQETIVIRNISGRTRYLPYAGTDTTRGCNLADGATSKAIPVERLENRNLQQDLKRGYIEIAGREQVRPVEPVTKDPPALPKENVILPPRVKPTAQTTPVQQAADPELRIRIEDKQPTPEAAQLYAEREAAAAATAKAEAEIEAARKEAAGPRVNPLVEERIAQLNMMSAQAAEATIAADLDSINPVVQATAAAVVQRLVGDEEPTADLGGIKIYPYSWYNKRTRADLVAIAPQFGIDPTDMSRSKLLEAINKFINELQSNPK